MNLYFKMIIKKPHFDCAIKIFVNINFTVIQFSKCIK